MGTRPFICPLTQTIRCTHMAVRMSISSLLDSYRTAEPSAVHADRGYREIMKIFDHRAGSTVVPMCGSFVAAGRRLWALTFFFDHNVLQGTESSRTHGPSLV